jgi:hypothetical protein
LGNNSTTSSQTPVQVSGLSNVVAIADGESHSLALESEVVSDSSGNAIASRDTVLRWLWPVS